MVEVEEPAGSKGAEPAGSNGPLLYAGAGAALAVAVAGALWLRSRAAARRAEAWKDAE